MTTLATARASTGGVVQLGHARWAIENEGFNELTTHWHADHVYRHEATALLVFTLLAMLCLNVFLAFYRRDLKPAARVAASRLHVARQVTAELYASPSAAPRAPPGRAGPQAYALARPSRLIPNAPPRRASPPAPPQAPTAHTNLHKLQFNRNPLPSHILTHQLRNRCL